MAGFIQVELQKISKPAGEWPEGWYLATIAEAKAEISKSSGNTMLVVTFQLHDENLGTTTVRDYISDPSGKFSNPNAQAFLQKKIQDFIMAVYDVMDEDFEEFMEENPTVGLVPDQLVNQQMLVNLGKEKTDDGRVFGRLNNPFYAAVSKWEDLVTA